MANNRMFIECDICKERFFLMKYYPSSNWYISFTTSYWKPKLKSIEKLIRWFVYKISGERIDITRWDEIGFKDRLEDFINKHEHYEEQPDEYKYGYGVGQTNFTLKFESSAHTEKEIK